MEGVQRPRDEETDKKSIGPVASGLEQKSLA
jgi:hypothetical protein